MFVPSEQNASYQFEKIRVSQGNIEFYRTILKDFNPDIAAFHAPHYLAIKNHVQSLTRSNTPFAVWIHGSEALFHTFVLGYVDPFDAKAKLSSVFTDPLKLALLRRLFQKANAVVYVSKWMKTITERQLLFRHPFSAVIPNLVDTELFRFKSKEPKVMRMGLAVRNFGWKYGLDIAIRAYSKLDETHLAIYGSGTLENYLRVLAQKCQSNVSFITEAVDHNRMPEVHNRFGYFVAPSRVEAQGVAMCEAMASGLPIISTKIGGIPEFVSDGKTGLLVPPEKPSALRRAILRLLTDEDLYESLSRNGRDFVEKNISADIIYAKEWAVLKKCMESEVF